MQEEAGQSAKADTLIHIAGFADPAVDHALMSSASAGRTTAAANALGDGLRALSELASAESPAQSSA